MSYYMGVTAEAGWQSAVALAWILLSLVSALLVGMLTKGRFALLLPILRKWCADVKQSKPKVDSTNVHILHSGDIVLAKPLISGKFETRWMRGRVLFAVAGIARVWFESSIFDDCDLDADNIRYIGENEGPAYGDGDDGDDKQEGLGDNELPDRAMMVFIPLEDEEDDYTPSAVAGVSAKLNSPPPSIAEGEQCCGPVGRGVFLVYAVQLLVYLLIAAVIGFLVFVAFYLTNVYNYTTGTAMFFVGMTFYSGFLLMFCCAFNKWQVTYTMHDFLGSAVILFLTLFIFIQLYGHSSISSYLSYRATGVLWMTVSLVPLYFFVGDRIKEGKAMVSRLRESTRGNGLNGEVIACPPVPRRNVFHLLSILFQDFQRKAAEEIGDEAETWADLEQMSRRVRGGVDSLAASIRLSTDEDEAADAADASSGLAWYYSRATKKGRKVVKRLCACSLASVPLDNVLWVASLAPYVLFVVLSWTSTASTADTSNASQRAPLVLLIVSVVNELTISTLVSETFSIFSQVIVSRYTLVLVGAHFWLMGAVIVLLVTSAFHASQIITLYLPSPGGMVAAVYDAVADLTSKEGNNRRASALAQADFEASLGRLRATEGAEEKEAGDSDGAGDEDGGGSGNGNGSGDGITRTPFSDCDDGGNSGGGGDRRGDSDSPAPPIGVIKARHGGGYTPVQTPGGEPHVGAAAIVRTFTGHGRAEIEADLRKNMQEAEKREQFRSQFFSLLLLQVAILTCILLGIYSTATDNLYLYPVRGKSQAAWGGLLWLMSLTLLFSYLVRHCVLTGGFGSMDSLIMMVLNISDLEQEQEPEVPAGGEGESINLSFTSIFSTGQGTGSAIGSGQPGASSSSTSSRPSSAHGRDRGTSVGRGRRDSRLLIQEDLAQVHSAIGLATGGGGEGDYSLEELQFVQRNRRGISKQAAEGDERELLKALRLKRRKREEGERDGRLRRKRAREAENTNIIANPPQPEHDPGEPTRKKIMRYFFAHFSDLVRPGLSGRTSVGFLVFAAYASLVGTATLGGWIAGTYIVIPLTAALPVAAFSFINWLRRWEAEGCAGFDGKDLKKLLSAVCLLWHNTADAVYDVHASYQEEAEERRRVREQYQQETATAAQGEREGAGDGDGDGDGEGDGDGDGDVEMTGGPTGTISTEDGRGTANTNAGDDGSSSSEEGEGERVDRSSRGSRVFSASFLYAEGVLAYSKKSPSQPGTFRAQQLGKDHRYHDGITAHQHQHDPHQRGSGPYGSVTGACNSLLTHLGRCTCYVIELFWAVLSSLFYTSLDLAEWVLEGNSLQFSFFNLLLALLVCLAFPLRTIALSIGGWTLSAAFTGMAIARWRASCEVDAHVVRFMVLSWLPTLAWSIGIGLSASTFGFAHAPGANLGTLVVVVLVLLNATALQVSIVTYVIWKDLVVMYPAYHRRVLTNSSAVDKIVRHDQEDYPAGAGAGASDEADVEQGMSTPPRGTTPAGSPSGTSVGGSSRKSLSLAPVSNLPPPPADSSWEAHDDQRWGLAPGGHLLPSAEAESPRRLHSVQKEWHCVAGAMYEISSDEDGDPSDRRTKGRSGERGSHPKPSGLGQQGQYCSLALCTSSRLHVTVLSPWAIGADRHGFPTSIMVLASAFVVTAVLSSAIFVTCLPAYRLYGLGMLLMAMYLFTWAYTRAGLLVVRSSLGYAKLGMLGLLVPFFCIAVGIIVLCSVYPEYTFWYLSLGWFGLTFAALHKGLKEDIFTSELKSTTPPFYFPVFAMRRAHVVEDSPNSCYIFVFLTMLALWAQWASQMVEPQEMGLLLYVLCIVAAAMYFKYTSGSAFYGEVQEEVTPEITHTCIDRSIRSLYKHVDTHKVAARQSGTDFHRRASQSGSGLDSPHGSKAIAVGGIAAKKRRRRSSVGLIGLKTAHKAEEDGIDLGGEGEGVDVEVGSPRGQAGAGTGTDSGLGARRDEPPLSAAPGVEEAGRGSRFVSAEHQRSNLEFIDALVDNRDGAAEYLDDTVAARCQGGLSSWPLLNLLWGYMDGSFSTPAGWNRMYRESLIVLHAHNNLITHSSGLSQLVAMIKLRALAMAAEDKRTREAELVVFLKDTQPSMREITVDDLSRVPTSLLVSLMDAFMDYRKSTGALQNIKEAKARQEEKIVAAQVKARQRKAILARARVEEEAKRRREQELRLREEEEREALLREQEQLRAREEEKRLRRQAEEEERKRQELQEEEELLRWQEEEQERREREAQAMAEAARLREREELRKLADKHRQEKEKAEAATMSTAEGSPESVVTTYGVEIGTDFKAALAELESKLEKGELSCTSGSSMWRHQYPNRFVDPDFGLPDLPSALGQDFEAADEAAADPQSNYGKMTLRRADTILPGLTSRLEAGGVMVRDKEPTPDNLHQGGIGDCWLIAGMATVCEQNDGGLIRAVFLHADHEKGIYALKIHINGRPRVVFVDDYLPTYVNDPEALSNERGVNNTQVAFCGLQRPEYFWCCLIEKAYAKLVGSYEHIVGGYEDVAMADLTGGIPKKVQNLQDAQNEKWNMLVEARRNGDLLGAGSLSGSDADKTEDGVVLGHAYSILDVREVEKHRLLQMRNPWGKGEWTGRWSDHSAEWTPRYRKLLGWEAKDDGKFWISFEDFCANYRTIYMCHMVNSHAQKVMQGRWSKADNTAGGYRMQTVPVFNVKCDSACKLTVVLQHNKTREDFLLADEEQSQSRKIYMGIQVYLGKAAKQKNKPWTRSKMTAESEYRTERAVVEYGVEAGQYVRVACATYEEGKEAEFSVNFYADCETLTVERVPNAAIQKD